MDKKIKVRKKYECLFEPKEDAATMEDWDLIYVHYQDMEGYVHYEYCGDGTQQRYMMTEVELYDKYVFVP